MPIIQSELLSNSSSISVIVDDVEILSISKLTYTQTINAARVANFDVGSLEDSLKCRIGAKITILVGRVPTNVNTVIKGTSLTSPVNFTNYYHFEGIVRQVNPTANGATVAAYDYVSLLKTSTYVEYKKEDVLGRDLYTLIADAANVTEIDTTNLLGGIGILATEKMQLTGFKTRKEFIDLCILNSISLVSDSTKYKDSLNPIYWQYAIRSQNVFDLFKLDPSNVHNKPVLKISLDSNNVYNITPLINTQRLVNSITIVNTGKEFSFTITDESSANQYGVSSQLITTTETAREQIETAAYELIGRYNKPTITYNVELTNTDCFCLGDYVEVTSNIVGTSLLPIQKITTNFTDGLTILSLGEKELSVQEMIKLIK